MKTCVLGLKGSYHDLPLQQVSVANTVSIANPQNDNQGVCSSSHDRGGGATVAQIRHTNFSNASLFNPPGFVARLYKSLKRWYLKIWWPLRHPDLEATMIFNLIWNRSVHVTTSLYALQINVEVSFF